MTQKPDIFEQAKELAASALQNTESRHIPATPMNFTIWYHYHAGSYPDLVRDLNLHIRNDAAFTEALNDEIYDKYFGLDRENEEVRETSGRIEAAATTILERLGDAGRDTADYGKKLAEFSGDVADWADGGDVRSLVQGILEETHQITEKNQVLESRLGASAKEISQLRQHLEEVRQEALTDALTRVANRRYFDTRLREEVAEHKESGATLSLLMLDIDHFKAFNDSFGHWIGDEVLKVVGRLLKNGVKGRDVPARYGGEEFAVILPRTRREDAVKVAEQLRHGLGSRPLKNRKTGQTYGTITVSVGVAQYNPGETIGRFIQRADKALYRAKRDGRNRVVAESDEESSLEATG